MGLLDSRRAVVTGGGSGIGRATCRRMTEEGARVAVVDVNGDAAEHVAKEIDGLAYAVDVTDYDALSAAVADAAARLDGLSTMFNNAGASNLSQVHDWPVEEFAYAEATAIAAVLLVISFAMLITINLLERWSRPYGA